MATLSEQERKRIQRYCIYPKIAGTALAMAFVLPFLIIPFEMIDDIVFHHESFQETGMMTALVLAGIELVIFCYCTLAPRFGMRGKQWREMQHRLVVEQAEKDRSAQIAGVIGTQAAARLLKNSDNETARNLGGAAEVAAAVGAVATAADVLAESFANAKAMAEARPPCKKVDRRACGAAPRDRVRCLYPAAGAGKHRDATERSGRGRADRHRSQGIRARMRARVRR